MNIGERIRQRRKELGKTLEEVGKVVGVSKQTIQRYESGEIVTIPYDKLTLLARALECSGADFFFDYKVDSEKYTFENATFSVEMLEDPTFLEYSKKLFSASAHIKQQVYTYIDFLLAQ